jgi:hypothetical protein
MKLIPSLIVHIAGMFCFSAQMLVGFSMKLHRSDEYHAVNIVAIFLFLAQNGCQSYKEKNLVQLSQVKLLAGF